MLRALLAILALHRVALGIAAALIIVYSLVGFLWVPHLLRTNAQSYVADELGRSLALGKISFNPFTFRLSVRDAKLSEKAGDDIATFGSLIVNAELASIWQRAVVLEEVQLDAPDVNLVVERDGSINLAHLAPVKSEAAAAAEAEAPLPRIRIGRLAVNGGRVDFEDRTRPAPFTATLAPIRFELEDFRTDLNHENGYEFAAQSSAGETLEWSGSFTAQPLGSQGQFAFRQVRIQTIQRYLQGQFAVRLVDGLFSFARNLSTLPASDAVARGRLAGDRWRKPRAGGACGARVAAGGCRTEDSCRRHAVLLRQSLAARRQGRDRWCAHPGQSRVRWIAERRAPDEERYAGRIGRPGAGRPRDAANIRAVALGRRRDSRRRRRARPRRSTL